METTGSPWVIIVFILFFGAIFGYIIFSKYKRKGATWVGTVIDKKVSEFTSGPTDNNSSGIVFGGSRNAINRDYSLRMRADTGEEFDWSVGEGFYATVNVGDRLSKASGSETPTKL